jgi:hypothetical protein
MMKFYIFRKYRQFKLEKVKKIISKKELANKANLLNKIAVNNNIKFIKIISLRKFKETMEILIRLFRNKQRDTIKF